MLRAVLFALRPGTGLAFQLGAGSKMIRSVDATSLKRWRYGQRLPAAFFIWFIVIGGVIGLSTRAEARAESMSRRGHG